MAYAPFSGAKRLREQLADTTKIVVCPGVYDGLTARLAKAAGFEALYMTGAGTSMSKLGWADLGIATLNDMGEHAAMIASLDPGLPLIADADTGYGGPIMVARTVAQYARAGVAALHIEDQAQEKRCGHLLGKEIVSRDTFYSRLRAAVAARNSLQSDMLIIARTDARQSLGYDEALERMKEAAQIGADALFLEAMESKEEAQQFCKAMGDKPCLLNMVPGGVTPDMSVEEAKAVGFRIIIFPGLSLAAAVRGLSAEFRHLLQHGEPTKSPIVQSPKLLFNACGLQECIDIDQAAGGTKYESVGK